MILKLEGDVCGSSLRPRGDVTGVDRNLSWGKDELPEDGGSTLVGDRSPSVTTETRYSREKHPTPIKTRPSGRLRTEPGSISTPAEISLWEVFGPSRDTLIVVR